MNVLQKYRADIKPLLWILLSFLVARGLFILLMPVTFSKDLYAWLNVIEILKAKGNPYSQSSVLNWPPFWMQILYVIHKLSDWSTIPAERLIQMVLISAEAFVLTLSYWILKYFLQQGTTKKLLI